MRRPAFLPAAAPTFVAALAAVGAAGMLTPRAARAQDRDPYTERRDATVSARGARRVEIAGAAGELRVVGVSGLGEVRVRGTARASRRAWLDDIRLVARRDGDVVVVRADIPDLRDDDRASFDYATRSLDLVIEVPRGIAADVSDGSGELEVRGVGALRVHDGSGSLLVEDVGPVEIVDGSGEIRVRNVDGDVRLTDGSGGIDVEHVRGGVVVERDGSGGITVHDVGGDFFVESGRGRGIDYADVRGRVILPESRSSVRERERERIRDQVRERVRRY